MTIAWIFPGQGSQTTGMGADLLGLPGVGARFEEAERILGWSVLGLESEQINRTLYTQPALFTISAVLSDQLRQAGQDPAYTAGHSLGEYSALYAAGSLDFATGLSLVQQRAQLMDGVSGGMMAALIGFDRAKLEYLCGAIEGVGIANDNSPDQVVVTGSEAAVQALIDQLAAKRTVKLSVSGAFHSPFMATAAAKFNSLLEAVELRPPRVPVYSNVTATASQDPDEIRRCLMRQMTGSVCWRGSVLNMVEVGVTGVWEIGPGNVLTGLVKRTAPALERVNVSGAAELGALLAR